MSCLRIYQAEGDPNHFDLRPEIGYEDSTSFSRSMAARRSSIARSLRSGPCHPRTSRRASNSRFLASSGVMVVSIDHGH